jgi:hypothetical protein
MTRTLKDGTPAGYGEQDRRMAEALSAAATPAERDKIAQAHGLRDAQDAGDWLRGRS